MAMLPPNIARPMPPPPPPDPFGDHTIKTLIFQRFSKSSVIEFTSSRITDKVRIRKLQNTGRKTDYNDITLEDLTSEEYLYFISIQPILKRKYNESS